LAGDCRAVRVCLHRGRALKVLFFATWFPHPLDNGSKIRVYHLLRGLAAAGHRISLLSFAFDTADVDNAQEVRELCADAQTIQRNPFQRSTLEQRLRFFSPTPIVSRPVREMVQAARGATAGVRFDAAIASTFVTAPYALMAPAGTVRILEEHNAMSRWAWDRVTAQKGLTRRMYRWLSWYKEHLYESRLFRRFALCTMVSEQDREYCLDHLPGYRGPMAVVPNGVDCLRNRPGLAEPVPGSLVFNGSLTYRVNYEAMRFFLADVYPRVRLQVPNATLTITGSTAGVDLSGLRLDESVRLTGLVDDVRPYVAGAWACVTPILQGGGTRLKVLEAMALGTPVVGTSKAVEGYNLVPDEHFLLADDAGEFARQTVCLLREPELRARLARAGRAFVEAGYDWRTIGRRFAELCEATVAEAAAR